MAKQTVIDAMPVCCSAPSLIDETPVQQEPEGSHSISIGEVYEAGEGLTSSGNDLPLSPSPSLSRSPSVSSQHAGYTSSGWSGRRVSRSPSNSLSSKNMRPLAAPRPAELVTMESLSLADDKTKPSAAVPNLQNAALQARKSAPANARVETGEGDDGASSPSTQPIEDSVSPDKATGSSPSDSDSPAATKTENSPTQAKKEAFFVEFEKQGNESFGLGVEALGSSVFVICVVYGSPAAKAGMRFGDEIMSINGERTLYMTTVSARTAIGQQQRVKLEVKRETILTTVVLPKKGSLKVGMAIKDGRIDALVPGSLAAINNVPTNQYIVFVDDVLCVGSKDSFIGEQIAKATGEIRLELMAAAVYDLLLRNSDLKLIAKISRPC